MIRWRDEETRLKVLQLQLNAYTYPFIIQIPGELIQKSKLGADKVAASLQTRLREETAKYGWRYAPRAKMAVSMRFTSVEPNPPGLHNLVKFYLDLFRQTVFGDDRQVHYLEASAWIRNVDDFRLESSVFIMFERFADMNKRFRLYTTLMRESEFREFLKRDYEYKKLLDDDNEMENYNDISLRTSSMMISMFLASLRGKTMSPDEIKYLEKLKANHQANYNEFIKKDQRQYHMLRFMKIEPFDHPSRPLLEGRLRYLAYEPLTINLGDLPSRGGSKAYKARIKEQIRRFSDGEKLFNKLHIPIELDIQISSKNQYLEKDLDNIARDIIPPIQHELIEQGARIHGYRIYVVRDSLNADQSDIRVKILPEWATFEFHERIEKTFEAGRKWIGERLRRSRW